MLTYAVLVVTCALLLRVATRPLRARCCLAPCSITTGIHGTVRMKPVAHPGGIPCTRFELDVEGLLPMAAHALQVCACRDAAEACDGTGERCVALRDEHGGTGGAATGIGVFTSSAYGSSHAVFEADVGTDQIVGRALVLTAVPADGSYTSVGHAVRPLATGMVRRGA